MSGDASVQSNAPGTYRTILKELAAIALSVLLFYLAFPNRLYIPGFGLLGFVALLPLFIVINTAPMWRLFLYGPLAGFATYAAFNGWLANFHPLAIFIVPVIYAAYFIVLLPALKLPRLAMGRFAWVGQVIIWLAYEYLRTQGFLGYSYGIIGYTQYLNTPLVNLASLGGVWLVSMMVILPQILFADIFASSGVMAGISRMRGDNTGRLNARRVDISVVAGVLILAVIYGFVSRVDYSDAPTMRMALIQQNVDPKIGGLRAYRDSMDASIRQTKLAMEEDENLDMIVWSETSFIPAIEFHTRYRQEPEKYELVDELLNFIDSTGVPVLLGNGDGQLARDESGDYVRHDYNAVYLYKSREEREIYRKLHLVPFTEYFPYEKQLPWLYRLLVESNTSFWYKGEDWTVFEVDGVKFSTPICFEDSFGYLSRGFVRDGADLIVNLTNDSWSKSVPAAVQHMAMAVFRATENRRSVVRSTNGGMTAVIDPNGRILAENEPFTESYIISDVPVYRASGTLYTVIGDLFAWIFTGLGCIVAIGSVVFALIRRIRKT